MDLGKGLGFLEHHADAAAQQGDVDVPVVDVLPFDQDLAVDPADVDQVVHAVEAAQQGRLAAAAGADESGDAIFRQVHADILQRLASP
jgi:hypothetical protein